jgi:hypothetical protein
MYVWTANPIKISERPSPVLSKIRPTPCSGRSEIVLRRATKALPLGIFAHFFLCLGPTVKKGLLRPAHRRKCKKNSRKGLVRLSSCWPHILYSGAVYKIFTYTVKVNFKNPVFLRNNLTSCKQVSGSHLRPKTSSHMLI